MCLVNSPCLVARTRFPRVETGLGNSLGVNEIVLLLDIILQLVVIEVGGRGDKSCCSDVGPVW